MPHKAENCPGCGVPVIAAKGKTTLRPAMVEEQVSPTGDIALTGFEGEVPLWRKLTVREQFGKKNLHQIHKCPKLQRWRRR